MFSLVIKITIEISIREQGLKTKFTLNKTGLDMSQDCYKMLVLI